MFLRTMFPLIHVRGNVPLHQGKPVGLCLSGRGCQSRDRPEKASMAVLSTTSTSFSWVLTAVCSER